MNSTSINTISPNSNESVTVSSDEHLPIMYYFIVVGALMLCCLLLIMLFYWYHHRNLVELIRVNSQPQHGLDTNNNNNTVQDNATHFDDKEEIIKVECVSTNNVSITSPPTLESTSTGPSKYIHTHLGIKSPDRSYAVQITDSLKSLTPDGYNGDIPKTTEDKPKTPWEIFASSNNSAKQRIGLSPPANLPYPTQSSYHPQLISTSSNGIIKPSYNPSTSTMPINNNSTAIPYGTAFNSTHVPQVPHAQITYMNGDNVPLYTENRKASNISSSVVATDFRTTLSELTTSSSASCIEDDEEDNFDSVSTRMNKRRKHKHHKRRKHRKHDTKDKHHKRKRCGRRGKEFVEDVVATTPLSEGTSIEHNSGH
mmetsp:Transcript_5418/g.4735  ORF Transcript_5418/g.4735 Transcript_5418/m.4735 type:complete len:368 (-) Transcript_5418:79-1182(-)